MSALDLSDFLIKRAKALDLSATSVAKQASISRQTWYRLVNADIKCVRIETLERVAMVLQASLIELSYWYTKKPRPQQQPLVSTLHIDNAYPFIEIINAPQDILVSEGEVFEKTWNIVNVSASYWVKRRLICVDDAFYIRSKQTNKSSSSVTYYGGLQPQLSTISIPLTAPGEQITLSTTFRAPKKSGAVISFWKMVNARGKACFPDDTGLSCQVRVVEHGGVFS